MVVAEPHGSSRSARLTVPVHAHREQLNASPIGIVFKGFGPRSRYQWPFRLGGLRLIVGHICHLFSLDSANSKGRDSPLNLAERNLGALRSWVVTSVITTKGLRARWHTATAHLLPDDDPRERQCSLASQMPSSARNAAAVRLFDMQLLTVGIDLDPGTFWTLDFTQSR
jgi:hypothetical protein